MRFFRLIGLLIGMWLLVSCASSVRNTPSASSVSGAMGKARFAAGIPNHNEQQRSWEEHPLVPQPIIPVTWQQVEGWQNDSLTGTVAALHENCSRVAVLPKWQRVCAAATQLNAFNLSAVRTFFERYFVPFQLENNHGTKNGLITGYYEPLLYGSRVRHAPYLYPLYQWPLGYSKESILPERLQLLRSGILRGLELAYVNDPVEEFFLQVQGSGRILMDDGSVMRVGYNGSNGQPYRSIGRWLIEHGELTAVQATMQGIKEWTRANPARVEALLAVNPRFVFFKEMPATTKGVLTGGSDGPIGALGVPLTPERSVAVDPALIPLGMPVFLSTTWPVTNKPLNRLVFAQDIGAAIKGQMRVDYFWGLGDKAGELAGRMKQSGQMWLLIPKS